MLAIRHPPPTPPIPVAAAFCSWAGPSQRRWRVRPFPTPPRPPARSSGAPPPLPSPFSIRPPPAPCPPAIWGGPATGSASSVSGGQATLERPHNAEVAGGAHPGQGTRVGEAPGHHGPPSRRRPNPSPSRPCSSGFSIGPRSHFGHPDLRVTNSLQRSQSPPLWPPGRAGDAVAAVAAGLGSGGLEPQAGPLGAGSAPNPRRGAALDGSEGESPRCLDRRGYGSLLRAAPAAPTSPEELPRSRALARERDVPEGELGGLAMQVPPARALGLLKDSPLTRSRHATPLRSHPSYRRSTGASSCSACASLGFTEPGPPGRVGDAGSTRQSAGMLCAFPAESVNNIIYEGLALQA